MKYLKTYEKYKVGATFDEPKFKIGDTIICIEGSDNGNVYFTLNIGDRFKVTNILKNMSGENVCKIKRIEDGYDMMGIFFCKNFIEELDYYTKKYNI